jgi:hypothetical protein
MKHHRYIGVTIFILLFIVPFISYAKINTLKKPVGGRVVSSKQTATVVCAAASGPIYMKPFNRASPGPYFVRTGTSGIPKASGYMLGNYSITPDLTTCTNPETGAPVPAFELRPYGVSR